MTKEKRQTNVLLVTLTIFTATFMTAIEGTIVSTAMPTIVGTLHGMRIMNWVLSVYLLTNAMMTPLYGKLADRIGRKPIFIFGLGVFVLGSFLCGLAQNMEMLIIFRAIQGIGAGAIMPLSFTIIADIYPFEKRAKVLGFNGAAWGIAGIVGPLLGGFLVDQLSWHWVFFINVPIGILAIFLMLIFLVEEKRSVKSPIDIKGNLLLMLALLSLLYGFQILGEKDFSVGLFISLMIGAMILFGLFIKVEKTAVDPIISLDLFKNRDFVVQNSVAAFVSGFLIGVEVYIPMWVQGVLGMSAMFGGLALAPMSITWTIGSFIAGHLLAKYAVKPILVGSLTILLIGGITYAMVPMTTPYLIFMLVGAFMGFGFGITITTTTVSVQNVVSQDQVGVATSFNTLVRTLGQTLLMSIYGVVLNMSNSQIHQEKVLPVKEDMMNQLINPQTARELPEKVVPFLKNILYQGLHYIYYVGVAMLIIAFIVNLLGKNKKVAEKAD